MIMRKVMLIEDEELILQGLKNIIDWESINMKIVSIAHNGQDALSLWEKEPVDIIVTDIDMPIMDGLEFLKILRKKDKRVRCILLTGYDEFEYARKAIFLDVEDYILKPIDEQKLELILKNADKKLNEFDQKAASNIDDKTGWFQFLRGNLSKEEAKEYINILPELKENIRAYPAIMKISLESLKEAKLTDVLVELQKEKDKIHVIYLSTDSLLLIYFTENESENEDDICKYLSYLQNEIESIYGILTFISLGVEISNYYDLPASYNKAKKLQKYKIIEGYGSCIALSQINNRKSEDIIIDENVLRKLILKKDKEGSLNYIEDLFINNIKGEVSIDDIYQLSLKIAMLLQSIKAEYKLNKKENVQNLTEIVDKIYNAEDLFTLKTIFISEVIEIIVYLNEDNSQYTPVVKQIMTKVQENYKEDMNLKTLAYKYNMNASYLGQIFQKEVGCSFAQYLSNIKNSVAKDLILNTNMKINDIAKEVGYPDTSYFYRKFKQCYGVSPASLREMKNY